MPIDFDPSRLPPEVLERARKDLRSWTSRYVLYGNIDLHRQRWREWAGPHFNQMMSSREETKSYLQHFNPNLRRTAVCMATSAWPTDDFFVRDLLRIAFEDSDHSVRGAALSALCILASHLSTGRWLRKWLTTPHARSDDDRAWVFSWLGKRGTEHAARYAEVTEQIKEHWRRKAGSFAAQIESSRNEAVLLLEHPDSQIRAAALHALYHRWKDEAFLIKKCELLISSDPDIKVREEAVTILSRCYSNTDDERVGRLLADIVCDSLLPLDLRWAAYTGLITIRSIFKVSPSIIHDTLEKRGSFDWDFVNSFMHSSDLRVRDR